LTAVNLLGALGESNLLILPLYSSRYFIVGYTTLLLALMMARLARWRVIVVLYCGWVIGLNMVEGVAMPVIGPPWRETAQAAEAFHLEVVDVWPDGWHMRNPTLDRPGYTVVAYDYASHNETVADCQNNCILVLQVNAGFVNPALFDALNINQVIQEQAVWVFVDGVPVIQGSSPDTHHVADFQITVERPPTGVTVNGWAPFAIAAPVPGITTASVLVIHPARRTIASQTFLAPY
jgi:hypothetical protein